MLPNCTARIFRIRSFLLLFVFFMLGALVLDAQGIFGVSEADEIAIGRQVVTEIEKDLVILQDREVTAYIDRLGQGLVQRSGRSSLQYVFKVVDSTEINAFAVPGGFVYVNRGLIEAARNESELAGVMGHEIGHIVGRHSADQIRNAQVANLGLRVLGGLLGNGRAAQIGNVAAQLAASGAFMRFSRDAEREADRLGARNVYDSGIDPQGMVTFFGVLANLRQSQPNAVEKFFSSHPDANERAANITALIRTLPVRNDLRADSPEFRGIKARLATLPRAPEKSAEAASPETALEGAEPELIAENAAEAVSVQLAAAAIPDAAYEGQEHDRQIAALFAPVFHQALGDSPRFDYITNFDFDGDWQGDNNWQNAAGQFPLRAYVYYAVAETATHYFIHYAAFHPRDYKGGARAGVALSEIIREGVLQAGQYDPTGRASEAVLAHENDLEGTLVVVEKAGGNPELARVVLVETLAHNQFLKYVPEESPRSGYETVMMDGRHPRVFIEPRGHGIEAFTGGAAQLEGAVNGLLTYSFTGIAEDPDVVTAGRAGSVGYDLVPFNTTFWPRARGGTNETYGEAYDYGVIRFQVVDPIDGIADREVTLGMLGSALNGTVGGRNMSRPAWGWFDGTERDRPLGEWFFSPAETIKRHFNFDASFSTAYEHHPFLGVFRGESIQEVATPF